MHREANVIGETSKSWEPTFLLDVLRERILCQDFSTFFPLHYWRLLHFFPSRSKLANHPWRRKKTRLLQFSFPIDWPTHPPKKASRLFFLLCAVRYIFLCKETHNFCNYFSAMATLTSTKCLVPKRQGRNFGAARSLKSVARKISLSCHRRKPARVFSPAPFLQRKEKTSGILLVAKFLLLVVLLCSGRPKERALNFFHLWEEYYCAWVGNGQEQTKIYTTYTKDSHLSKLKVTSMQLNCLLLLTERFSISRLQRKFPFPTSPRTIKRAASSSLLYLQYTPSVSIRRPLFSRIWERRIQMMLCLSLLPFSLSLSPLLTPRCSRHVCERRRERGGAQFI